MELTGISVPSLTFFAPAAHLKTLDCRKRTMPEKEYKHQLTTKKLDRKSMLLLGGDFINILRQRAIQCNNSC